MKRLIALFLLSTFYTFAQSLEANVSLASHTDSSFGEWKLTKIAPENLDSFFKGKIVQLKSRSAPYYIESTDIEIFDKKLYLNHFLKKGYSILEWIAKKGTMGDDVWNVSESTKNFLKESEFYKNYHAQDGWEEVDWSMVLADYINSTIGTLPTYNLAIKNQSKTSIELLKLYTKTIYTMGGEASPGGAYFQANDSKNRLILQWDKESNLTLNPSITIQPQKSNTLPLSIVVKKGAQGDGPGQMTFGLFIQYKEKGKIKEELLTILNQSEDYGYLTGW